MKQLFERIRRDWKLLLNEEEKVPLQYQSTLGYLFSASYVGNDNYKLLISI